MVIIFIVLINRVLQRRRGAGGPSVVEFFSGRNPPYVGSESGAGIRIDPSILSPVLIVGHGIVKVVLLRVILAIWRFGDGHL